jgi:hypothetical protein
MPLMKFNILRGRSKDEIKRLLDVAHNAMVRSFDVPERDRYQVITEHDPEHFIAEDTGLAILRSKDFVLLEVVSRPRSVAMKEAFYANLSQDLLAECGIASSDVMVTFVENTDADWSFGLGRPQFLTGEL